MDNQGLTVLSNVGRVLSSFYRIPETKKTNEFRLRCDHLSVDCVPGQDGLKLIQ